MRSRTSKRKPKESAKADQGKQSQLETARQLAFGSTILDIRLQSAAVVAITPNRTVSRAEFMMAAGAAYDNTEKSMKSREAVYLSRMAAAGVSAERKA